MEKTYSLILWVVRLLGGLLIGFMVFLLVGQFFAPKNYVQSFSLMQSFQMAAFITMNIGLVVAYWKEILGGSIAFGAHVLFAILEYTQTGQLSMTWVFALYLTVSFGYIIIGWYRQLNSKSSQEQA